MNSTWHTVACSTALGSHTMHYQCWPATGVSRGTVLCVHGLTRNSYDFERLALALSAEGYCVLAPDIVGRGRSDRLSDATHYNYATYVADLLTLVRHEDLRDVVWVGTSMGGILGMMLAAQVPGLVAKLVLNDIGAFIPQAALERIVSYVANPPRFATLADAESYCRKIYAPFGLVDDADWQAFTQNSITPVASPTGADDDYVLAFDPAIGTALAATPLTDVNLWPLWEALWMPTLIVRGAESDVLPADTAATMLLKPQAQLQVFTGCGHAPSLMVPDQIAVVLDYVINGSALPGRTLGRVWQLCVNRFKGISSGVLGAVMARQRR
jgi:pimeloyl-ACP methyl ester carboxylesterase